MSIDALVQRVTIHPDGSGSLALVDRPARPGGVPGVAGQPELTFERGSLVAAGLEGCQVWGGADSLMLGDREIAARLGYGRIRLCDPAALATALALYHRAGKPYHPRAAAPDLAYAAELDDLDRVVAAGDPGDDDDDAPDPAQAIHDAACGLADAHGHDLCAGEPGDDAPEAVRIHAAYHRLAHEMGAECAVPRHRR